MKPLVIDSGDASAREAALGAIICEEVSVGGRRLFHKGHRVVPDDLDRLATVGRRIHAVWLDPDDVHEDEAGMRLATALAGSAVSLSGPKLSRVNLIAGARGLLRIDGERVTAINRLPGMSVFTIPDRLSVNPGKVLAGAKITPVAVGNAILREAEGIAAGSPVIKVKPFLPRNVGVVTTEHLEGRARERFEHAVRGKIDWFGGTILGFADLPNEAGPVAHAIERFLDDGADLILTGGGNTIDPFDAAVLALDAVDAEIVKSGVPAHPGSMFWLAYRGEVPIFNLASCSMYSQATSADLVLPWIMAGERITLDDLAGIGFGGLLEGKEMAFRFPPYDSDSASGCKG